MNPVQNAQEVFPEEVREKIMVSLGIENAPKEKQDEVLVQIGETAFQKILIAVLDRLDESAQQEYDTLLERDPDFSEIEFFFKSHIPDYEELVKKVVDDFMESLRNV